MKDVRVLMLVYSRMQTNKTRRSTK